MESRRTELNKEAVELDKKRSEYIKQERAKQGKKTTDGFDSQVLRMLRKQAAKYDIKY